MGNGIWPPCARRWAGTWMRCTRNRQAPPRRPRRPPAAPVFDQAPPPAMDVPRGSLAAAQLVKAQADAKRAALEVRRLEKRLLDSDEVSGHGAA